MCVIRKIFDAPSVYLHLQRTSSAAPPLLLHIVFGCLNNSLNFKGTTWNNNTLKRNNTTAEAAAGILTASYHYQSTGAAPDEEVPVQCRCWCCPGMKTGGQLLPYN